MAPSQLALSDLSRGLGDVARALPSWRRGEPDEAARETLEYAAGAMHRSSRTIWAWMGRAAGGEPAVALPVTASQAIEFRSPPHSRVVVSSLGAAAAAGASVARLRLEGWRGLACLVAPGMDPELFSLALAEACAADARVSVESLPEGVALGGPPLLLTPAHGSGGGELLALARELAVHPVRVIVTLLAHDQPFAGPYPSELAHSLREWGCAGERAPVVEAPPSLAIDDDPCPRRQHARIGLRRMRAMKKIGPVHHTEFDHFYRGAAPHERRRALEVAEELLRAGLLGEKPSVGQRHIYLNVKRMRDIDALIDRGETRDPALAQTWTAPAPGGAGASTAPPQAPPPSPSR
jgi:hypothetical protein